MKAGQGKSGVAGGGSSSVASKKPYKPKATGAKKPTSATKKTDKSAPGDRSPDGRSSPSNPPLTVATPVKDVPAPTSVRTLSRRLTMNKLTERAAKKEAISTVDPDDVEEDPTKGRCMLTPTAPIKMKWDIVMLFLILYNVIMVPVRICFEVEAPAGSIEFWLETFFDMLFLVDIVLNFNSAYVNDEGSLETNRSKIASTYLKGWFLIDGPSSLPTEPVIELIGLAIPSLGLGSSKPEVEGCAASGDGDTAMMMPKLLRFLRMFRFMKLIRLLKAAKIFKVMEEELDINMSVLKLFKLVFIVVFLGHLIACFVFLANKMIGDGTFGMFRLPQFYGCQNTTTEEWVDLLPDDWSPSIGNAYPEWPREWDCQCETGGIWRWKILPGEQYVWVLYWTLTTMTTIGYGDVSPLTYVEAIITVIVEVAGASIFGYMIGNIASVIADFDKFSSVQKERMEEIKSYLTFKRVPRALSKSVRKYYGHYYDRRGVDALKQDWGALPNIIKAELVKFMNKEFVDQFHCFLPVAGYDFIEVLVEQLRPLMVELGTVIAGVEKQPPAPSPPSCDFFLICTGEVHKLTTLDPATEVSFKEGDDNDAQGESGGGMQLLSLDSRNSSSSSRLERIMRPGEWFGHIELLAAFDEIQAEEETGERPSPLQWRHEYKAKRICELLYLVSNDFYSNIDSYSLFRDVLEVQDAGHEEDLDEEDDLEMGGKAAPAISDSSTVLSASSSSAGEYGAPPPVSVPEGDVLDNRHLGDQQSSDSKRDLLSPAAAVAGIAGLAAAKKAARAASAGKPAAMKGIDVAAKWGGAKPKAAAGAPHPPHSQAQLDAQLLRQKIETEVFGLPLRRADQITDSDILALIRSRAESALPAPASAPSAASGPGTPKAPVSSGPLTPSRTPRPSSDMSD